MNRFHVRAGADRGQAAISMMLLSVALFTMVGSAIVALGDQSVARTRAQTAADAAALASVVGGRAAAVRYAETNGAVLVSFLSGPDSGEVTVVVQLDGQFAKALATGAP